MTEEGSLTSSFPIIWILLKWVFEVANYWAVCSSPLNYTFCAGCLLGVPRGGGIGERWCGVVGGGQWTAGMQYVRGPMSALSVASDGKEEGGGWRWGWRLCGSYENCSVLKQWVTATLHNIPQSHTISHTVTLFSSFFFSHSYIYTAPPQLHSELNLALQVQITNVTTRTK